MNLKTKIKLNIFLKKQVLNVKITPKKLFFVMNYNIETHKEFEKELKTLSKKFPSLKSDLEKIIENIKKELALADDLGDGFKKIRINIKSKNKGSAGGGRIISYETIISVTETNVLFGCIYNKGEYVKVDLDI